MVVPKAAIYQTQTFYAKGKMKEVKQLVANLRGESLSSGKTETWNGKMLKIPPVSPSILDCSIIRVEYSLMVSTLFYCIWTKFMHFFLLVLHVEVHHYSARYQYRINISPGILAYWEIGHFRVLTYILLNVCTSHSALSFKGFIL